MSLSDVEYSRIRATACAGEIAGMQRLELQNRGKFLRPAELVADNVRSDFSR